MSGGPTLAIDNCCDGQARKQARGTLSPDSVRQGARTSEVCLHFRVGVRDSKPNGKAAVELSDEGIVSALEGAWLIESR